MLNRLTANLIRLIGRLIVGGGIGLFVGFIIVSYTVTATIPQVPDASPILAEQALSRLVVNIIVTSIVGSAILSVLVGRWDLGTRVKSFGLGCLVGVSIAVILTLTVAYLRGELPLQSKLTSQSTVDFGRRVIVPVLAVVGGMSGLVIEHRRTRKSFEDRSNAIHL